MLKQVILSEREIQAIKSCLQVACPVEGEVLTEEELNGLAEKLGVEL